MKLWFGLVVLGLLVFGGCLLFPPAIRYQSILTPVPDAERVLRSASGAMIPKDWEETLRGQYTLKGTNVIAYEMEGCRIEVEAMTDEALNALFPEESSKEEYSTNPYTYGNWVDPAYGYTPNRFTTFRVTVYNYTFAKVLLNPLEGVLYTDQGDKLHAYGIEATSPYGSFEQYYKRLRGQSGNEYYRYDQRIGILRSYNYGNNELIFKGEHYGGFIVFDPLSKNVKRVALVLRDVVLRFDAFGRPLEQVDVPFVFDRHIEHYVVTAVEKAAKEEAIPASAWVRWGTVELSGAASGDVRRDESAVRSALSPRFSRIGARFKEEFEAGRCSEGEVTVSFKVWPNGKVEEVMLVYSSVGSPTVEQTVVEEVAQVRLQPLGSEGSDQRSGDIGESEEVVGRGPLVPAESMDQMGAVPVRVTMIFARPE